MKLVILLLMAATLQVEAPKLSFEKVATEAQKSVIVERFRATEGTEQIWLVSTADPSKRHLLYTHHRQAGIMFSDDETWLVINDHCGSAGSSLLLYRRKDPPVYEKVVDLTEAAWRFFNQRNALAVPAKGKSQELPDYDMRNGPVANPFDHRYIDAVCWVGNDSPILFIRMSGHISGPAGIIKASRGWYCLYDIRTKSFSTDLDALNTMNTKL